MLVIAGSARTQAISSVPRARSSAARSLNSIATVVSAGSTGGPALPARARVPSGVATAKVSSTLPW